MSYEVKLPVGASAQFLAALDNLKPEQILSYYRHRVKKGETISTISWKYGEHQGTPARQPPGVQQGAPRRERYYHSGFNRSKQRATIKIPQAQAAAHAQVSQVWSVSKAGKATVTYRISKGDTLFRIPHAADVEVSDIRGWNRIGNTLSVGQQIVLYLTPGQALKFKEWVRQNKGEVAMAGPEPKKFYHQVRPGDTLSQIAHMHQVLPQDLMT